MSHATLRELAHREQDGLEVILLWDARSNEVSIGVADQRNESILRAAVPGRLALNAFHHPYTYILGNEGSRALASAIETRWPMTAIDQFPTRDDDMTAIL